jgi:C1A family cysteine protease
MKKLILVVAALVLILSLLYSGLPGEAKEPQFTEAPKRAPVVEPGQVSKLPGEHGMGFVPLPMDMSHLTGQKMPGERLLAQNVTLPTSFDWRTQDKVTSVKNQGPCGSCWAFAALANFESKILVDGQATLPDPDFSENNAKECNYEEIHNINGGTSCSGGNSFEVANLLSQKGTVTEACDPYVASDVACKGTCPYQDTLLDWRIICENNVPDTGVLKTYIMNYGPVFTTMFASFTEFYTYNGTSTLYYTGTGNPDHAVLIVGWDDSLSHAGGSGGWIVKNSWGTDWGNEGYFTIAYGSAGIGKNSSYVYGWQAYDESGRLYYYDDCGMTNALGEGVSNTTCWGLCVFTPVDNAPIKRVEFWTTDITSDIDIYLYDDFDGANLSNLLASKLNNSFSEAGYHSVELDTPVPVSTGDDVIAVVKFTNAVYPYPLVVDDMGPIETGRTYISLTGDNGTWYDLGTELGYIGYFDACIRLRTGLTPPSVITETATEVTARSATLHGSLDNLGDYSSANVSFEWGLDTGYGNETPPQKLMTEDAFSDNINGLDPGMTYHFRAKAAANGVTVYGDDSTLTTCIPGDVNGDEAVNVNDLEQEIMIILGRLPPTCGADANEDGIINVQDLVAIRITILGP